MDNEKQSINRPEQFKHVSNAAYIERGGYTLLVRRIIFFIAALVAVFLMWASIAKIDEVAVSFGEVMPVADVHIVQHVQGGTIEKIYVKNGDEVQEGQPLIKLDPDATNTELEKAQSAEVALLLNAARLRAFIEKKPANAIDWQAAIKNHPYRSSVNDPLIQKSIKEDIELLQQQNNERKNQELINREKITQKEAELKQLTDSIVELQKKLVLYQKEEDMYRSVVDKGYVSKRDYLEAQRKTIETTSQVKQTEAKINAARSAIQEAQEELSKIDMVMNKQSQEKLDNIDAELSASRYTVQRLTDLQQKLLVKAPVTGIVKGLDASVGSVIAPGNSILEIVPSRGQMLVQCKISTKDIGHVKLGDPAEVKVLAYEFTRYGMVNGKVTEISASTFTTTDKNLPYYKGKVSLEKNYVGNNPKENILIPGMTVEVDIITGKKTVLEYLIKPITRGLQTSFREP